jgi:hypothetical protein
MAAVVNVWEVMAGNLVEARLTGDREGLEWAAMLLHLVLLRRLPKVVQLTLLQYVLRCEALAVRSMLHRQVRAHQHQVQTIHSSMTILRATLWEDGNHDDGAIAVREIRDAINGIEQHVGGLSERMQNPTWDLRLEELAAELQEAMNNLTAAEPSAIAAIAQLVANGGIP